MMASVSSTTQGEVSNPVESSTPVSSQSNLDMPLALRKSPRATAGIKKEPIITVEKMEAALYASKKESQIKTANKRKLSMYSPTPSNTSSKEDETLPPVIKKKKNPIPKSVRELDSRNDFYCWICHKEGSVICCEVCPRVYHVRCLKLSIEPEGDWFCPECEKVTKAECVDTQSESLSKLSCDQFCRLLMFALQRMKHGGSEPFHKPVQLDQHPDYPEFVFYPMDLSTLEKNIARRMYGCTEAFLADARWIIHNCIIYNGGERKQRNHKLTASARMIIKICEHEMNEIEVCSDCYLSSCLKKDNYFCEPCTVPHPLVWAKLKGFPFWPAKALREVDGQVDVRFFGQHDRAWVPANCCYMMSKDIPFAIKKRKGGFENAMQEMDLHIENIRRVHKNWEYAPYRMPYDPSNTYIHNYLKNKPNSINGESNDASTPKVGKIKIRIKRESGKSTLTLESGSSNLGGVKDKSIDEDSKDNVGESIMKNSKSKDEVCKKSPQLAAGNAKSTEIKTECSPDSTTEKSPNSRKSNLESVDVSTKTVSRSKMEMSNDVPTVDDAHITKVLSLKTSGTDTTSKDVNKLADEANMDTSAVPETENEKQLSESKHIKESSKNSSKEPAPSILPTKLPSLSNLEGATTPPRIETPGTPPMKLTPVSDKFAIHLDRTIESCKASLGIKETDNLDEMETEDRDSDSDCLSMHCETSSENSDWEHEEQGEEREEEEESNKAKEGNHEVVSKQPSDEDTTKKIESVDVKVDESPESENVDRKVKKIDSPSIDEVKKSKIAKLDDHMTKSPDKKNENKSKNEEKNHLDVQITETQNKNKKETVQHQSVNSAPKIDNNPHNIKVAANSSNNTTKTSPVKFSARLAEKAAQKSVDEVTSLESDGPVSAKDGLLHQQSTAKKKTDFKKYTDKIVDYIEGTFQEFYSEVLEGSDKMVDDIPTATVGSKTKNLELEMMQWKHQQEISEIKHIAELTVAEIREGLLQEKNNAIADVKKDLAVEKEKAIKETKKKQWCAYCGKEAIFYCCWNTSYCDYPCQQTHWKEHMNVCTQATNSGTPTDQTDYDTQVRTAVSIQQSPEVNAKSGEIPVTQPSGVLVTQPMQVKYIRQTLPQPTTSIHGQQVVVRTPVTAYNTMQLGPMNTLTRAPTTIVQQRPIIQHTNYPVLRPQGGFPQGVATQIVPATQGMPTQLVMPHASTVQSAAAAAAPVQLRNIVSYSQSRPV